MVLVLQALAGGRTELYILEGHDVITGLDIRHIRSDAFDNTCTLMAQDDRKGTFWVFAT